MKAGKRTPPLPLSWPEGGRIRHRIPPSPRNRGGAKRNLKNIEAVFRRAEEDGRSVLLEPEAYAVLREAGIRVPRFLVLPAGRKASAREIAALGAPELVLKIVSPLVLHKSDVGGVAFVKASAAAVNAACAAMIAEVPRRYAAWAKGFAKPGTPAPTAAQVRESIRGVLVCERVRFVDAGYGSEIMAGLRNTREFGPVVSFGTGGTDVEFMAERLKPGRGNAVAAAHLFPGGKALEDLLRPLVVTGKLARDFRGRKAVLAEAEIARVLDGFRRLAVAFSPFGAESPYVLEDLEVNPFVVRGGRCVPLDGLARFSRAKVDPGRRPLENLQNLLRPRTIGIIGVSEKMNVGRMILQNVLRNGFPAEGVFIVKPGVREIDGCRCVPTIADLPVAVDLFVLTLGAEQCPPVMNELVRLEKARSVIIIAGGMGEKEGTGGIEDAIRRMLADARAAGRPTPVVNGGNCLGIASRPGRYDTTFIPERKLPRPKGFPSGLAFVSQSGAFMISRMSRLGRLEPLYAVSLGNQLDLTASDYLKALADDPEASVLAVYMEGFRPGDGLEFARAAAEISRRGRRVIVYKSGRSPEGRAATSSHTASVAGDYDVFRSILRQAGAVVTEGIAEFESWLKAAVFLRDKPARGNRVGLISNAGFEAVVMADGLAGEPALRPAAFSESTRARISEALKPLGIDKLQDIHDPLDVTPVADDAAFMGCAEAILDDPEVDCAVVSPVPMTAALQTLPAGEGHGEDFRRPGTFATRMVEAFRRCPKPVVVNIDAGEVYDPLADFLEGEGLPVFRRADDAMRFLRDYAGTRG